MNVDILMPMSFDWAARKDFVRKCGQVKIDTRYVLDFSLTSIVDAVGLGLLLQLSERVGKNPERLFLVRAGENVKEAILAAGLGGVANLKYPDELEVHEPIHG